MLPDDSAPSLTTSPAATAATSWQQTSWRGEVAWSSTRGGLRAVVTELRQRLIYFGATEGTLNLLNAPYPRRVPDANNRWPNQGGHRFWLGPQKLWVWPPLTEWEFSGASRITAEDGVLSVCQPQLDASYPAITREYSWEGSCLRCTARWRDDGRSYFGMHVIPVDLPFAASAQLVRTPEVPLGLVDVQMDQARASGFLPHPALALDGDRAQLAGGRKVLKVGFSPQALTVKRSGGWTLAVHPGETEGTTLDLPDFGYLSQIWVGAPEHDLAELEQLTPFLRGGANGVCASSIYIEATRANV